MNTHASVCAQSRKQTGKAGSNAKGAGRWNGRSLPTLSSIVQPKLKQPRGTTPGSSVDVVAAETVKPLTCDSAPVVHAAAFIGTLSFHHAATDRVMRVVVLNFQMCTELSPEAAKHGPQTPQQLAMRTSSNNSSSVRTRLGARLESAVDSSTPAAAGPRYQVAAPPSVSQWRTFMILLRFET